MLIDRVNRSRCVALSAALSLASCAGGAATSRQATPSTPRALSKSAYIARADGICAKADVSINGLEPAATDDEIDEYADEIMSLSEDAIADLRDLHPPASDAAFLDAMIDGIARSVRLIPDYVRARQAEDSARAADIAARLERIQGEIRKAAREYGFERCGEAEGSPSD
jgi:protein-tyrosine-phosphatase